MGRTSLIQIGDAFNLSCGSSAVVVGKNGYNFIDIVTSNGHRRTCSSMSLRRGAVKDVYQPTIMGLGYVGVGSCSRTTAYDAYRFWVELLRTVEVGKMGMQLEWFNFQIFAKWFDSIGWSYGMRLNSTLINPLAYRHGKDTTVLIPKWLDVMLAERADGYDGVSLSYNRWRSRLKVKKEIVAHGYHDTKKEAMRAYNLAKREYVAEAICDNELPKQTHAELKRIFGIKVLVPNST